MTYQLVDPAVGTRPVRTQRTLQVLVDDAATVLARFALLLSRRDVELMALSVHRMDNPGTVVLLVELDTTAVMVDHLSRRLSKMINVIEVTVHSAPGGGTDPLPRRPVRRLPAEGYSESFPGWLCNVRAG